MNPKSIIISLSTNDLAKSFKFYKEGLGVQTSTLTGPILTVEFGESTIFFINKPDFERYTSKAKLKALNNKPYIESILSASFETNEEVDELLKNIEKFGGEVVEKGKQELWGYTAYFRDPDGHLWELVSVIKATPVFSSQ